MMIVLVFRSITLRTATGQGCGHLTQQAMRLIFAPNNGVAGD
jgi:hypothetical protein